MMFFQSLCLTRERIFIQGAYNLLFVEVQSPIIHKSFAGQLERLKEHHYTNIGKWQRDMAAQIQNVSR
jgi:hypothetical protein